jgi:hypothetical protein
MRETKKTTYRTTKSSAILYPALTSSAKDCHYAHASGGLIFTFQGGRLRYVDFRLAPTEINRFHSLLSSILPSRRQGWLNQVDGKFNLIYNLVSACNVAIVKRNQVEIR